MAIAGNRTRAEKKRASTDHRDNRYNQHTNTRTPVDGLVVRLDGIKIQTDYYNKQVAMNETIVEFDINDYSYLRNFNRIENLLITVKTEIPTTGNVEDIKGTGLISAEILPTIGDVFLVTLSGNTTALMAIKRVQRLSYNNLDVYEVDYSAIKLLLSNTDIDDFIGSMSRGIIGDYVYDDAYQNNNTTPIIGRKELTTLNEIIHLHDRLLGVYLDKCYNASNETLLLVRNDSVVLDPHLQDFIDKTIDYNNTSGINRDVYRPNLPKNNRNTIFEALLKGYQLKDIDPYFDYLVAKENLPYNSYIDTILFDRAYGLVSVHNRGYFERNPLDYCNLILPEDLNQRDFIDTVPTLSSSSMFPTQFKDTYVLSPGFYNVIPSKVCIPVDVLDPNIVNPSQPLPEELTDIEILTSQYIEGDVIDKDLLSELLIEAEKLTYEEAVYMIPLVLFLAKTVLTSRADAF